jgi:drug/metabolite transporter (DMT)-like permease
MWKIFIFYSIILFVIGQIFLKYDSKNDSLINLSYFTITMGFFGLIYILYHKYYLKEKIKIHYYSIIAGLVFFFGNLFWIKSIKNSPSLSNVRILMAGGETLLLLIVGYILFQQSISFKQILGIFLILSGIFII